MDPSYVNLIIKYPDIFYWMEVIRQNRLYLYALLERLVFLFFFGFFNYIKLICLLTMT